eukprot:UN03303
MNFTPYHQHAILFYLWLEFCHPISVWFWMDLCSLYPSYRYLFVCDITIINFFVIKMVLLLTSFVSFLQNAGRYHGNFSYFLFLYGYKFSFKQCTVISWVAEV